MTCQLKNIIYKKIEVAFLSANTWDVSGGGNYGYNSILKEIKIFLIILIIKDEINNLH